MKYFLVFFLPVLIFSQQDNLSDGTGSYRQYFDENKTSRKHGLKNVIGSTYYHKDYSFYISMVLLKTQKLKKIRLKKKNFLKNHLYF